MDGEIVARLLVYVDDIVVSGAQRWILAILNRVQSIGTCKISGLLARKQEVPGVKYVQQMTFLAITTGFRGDELYMQRHQYSLTNLKDKLLHGKGKACLPMPSEGQLMPEIKDGMFEKVKKEAQQEVGTVMWLSPKTRPDIATVISDAASHVAHNPTESLRICKGI